jgi:hypothetical protein
MLLCTGKHCLGNWVLLIEARLYYKHDSRTDAFSYGVRDVIMIETKKKERGDRMRI